MGREERRQLHAVVGEVHDWVLRAHAVKATHTDTIARGDYALRALRGSVVQLTLDGRVAWRALLLRPDDGQLLAAIAARAHLPAIGAAEARAIEGLTTDAAAALEDVRAVLGTRRFFSGTKKRDAGASAAHLLRSYQNWGEDANISGLLDRLSPSPERIPAHIPVDAALADWVGLKPQIRDLGWDPQIVPASIVAGLANAVRAIDAALSQEARFRRDATAAGEAVRNREVRRLLASMPVERLKEATGDRLRIGPLTDAGISTVQAVLDRDKHLENLPNIGATSATRIRGAARTLWQTTHDEMPVRIDIKARTPEASDLLHALNAWDAVRTTRGATADLALKDALTPLAHAVNHQVSHLLVYSGARSLTGFSDAVQRMAQLARPLAGSETRPQLDDPWDDFLSRPSDYYALLSELGFLTEDETKTHGDLPDEIVEAVRKLELDSQYLTASLRGYQSFGARFALVQRKVIIGDEMGLGKTVEALAALAHLRAKGSHHFLVICPAAVVTNWIREIQSKSRLGAHRLHGPGREAALRGWIRNGGVGVTTYETQGWLEGYVHSTPDLGCIVVDEAHYIKNPNARRSHRAATVIRRCQRAVLLTGTPLENRIDEFRALVGYLRPDLVIDGSELAPKRFRRQVAPAYLRRNQEDVLTELPELVEVEEWLPMSSHDAAAYREAVAEGNFMAMRQAAMTSDVRSEKVARLIEIVEEAEENGRRVIVFSHFLNVLDLVMGALPGRVFGPLTGRVPAAARQLMVDQFSKAGHGAVLVAQIEAGGVGLNIQAASVVVICEPQLKPTTEWQAIARAHRMGQLESVQVHRLLSEVGVDQRITDILAHKRQLFEDFARDSETARSAPEALDISEAELAREVVAAERERLFAGPASTDAALDDQPV